jgi:hypothetical protein
MRASRQIKLAEAGQLTAMSDGLALIMDNQRFVNPLLLTNLCELKEEIAAEFKRRSTEDGTAAPATGTHPRSALTASEPDSGALSPAVTPADRRHDAGSRPGEVAG